MLNTAVSSAYLSCIAVGAHSNQITVSASFYIGRFAPSPSGPLHMGSLVCALASFLWAKSQKGTWLLRIEDLDPPREQTGATESIIHTLRSHGLHWDAPVMYQSQRSEAYRNALAKLNQRNLSYPCGCNRKRLTKLNGIYDGHCLSSPPAPETPTSIRLNTKAALTQTSLLNTPPIIDDIQGALENTLAQDGDFTIHRKDGLFAYQLAVVVDDITQGINHIVRGTDLMDCAYKQQLLTLLLGAEAPRYAHIPVLVQKNGLKLSKQNHAPAINNEAAKDNLIQALYYLYQSPPTHLHNTSIANIIQWAVENWQSDRIPATYTLPADA